MGDMFSLEIDIESEKKRDLPCGTIQVTVPDDGHLRNVKLSTTIMWMM